MAVFDTMRHIRPDVSTVCIGLAASMGAFLLASGQQVRPGSGQQLHHMLMEPRGQGAGGSDSQIRRPFSMLPAVLGLCC